MKKILLNVLLLSIIINMDVDYGFAQSSKSVRLPVKNEAWSTGWVTRTDGGVYSRNGKDGHDIRVGRAFLRTSRGWAVFNAQSIPRDAKILSATLRVYCNDPSSDSNHRVQVKRFILNPSDIDGYSAKPIYEYIGDESKTYANNWNACTSTGFKDIEYSQDGIDELQQDLSYTDMFHGVSFIEIGENDNRASFDGRNDSYPPSLNVVYIDPPDAPTASSASNVTSDCFTANWGTVNFSDGYRLDVATNSSFTNYVSGYNNRNVGNTTSERVCGLDEDKPYYYRVRAYNQAGDSPNSNEVPLRTLLDPPDAPRATDPTNITSSSFTANWNSVSGADGYRLDVATNSSFTSYVPGYENLNVENTINHPISGLEEDKNYYYRVRAYNQAGDSPNSNTISATTLVSVEQISSDIPNQFELSQNYPNPFNPNTIIRFGLPEQNEVVLEIYNLMGQRVARLINETKNAGWHEVTFDATGLSSGTYIYRIKAGNHVETKQMIFVK